MLAVHPFSILSKGSCNHLDKIETRTLGEITDGYEISMIYTNDQSNNVTIVRVGNHRYIDYITFVMRPMLSHLFLWFAMGCAWIATNTLLIPCRGVGDGFGGTWNWIR
jgi:hypothetical protein